MNAQRNTAVVTGASSGIGFAIANSLLAQGWNVVGSARTRERLEQARTRLQVPDRFLGLEGDIAQPATAEKLVRGAVERFGQLDLLVNNAGVFLPKPFVDFTPEEIEEQIATNLKGALYASQHAARHMIGRGRGHIIQITASVAIKPYADVPAALAALLKGGLNDATRAMALELAPHGVRVNAVAPGIIATPMHSPDAHASLQKMLPVRRLGTAQEVADAVLYLARAAFVNGVVLPVDGGMAAGNV